MKTKRSLKKGWCTFQDAVKMFRTTKSNMSTWKLRYPECFEEISARIVMVNYEELNKIKRRF